LLVKPRKSYTKTTFSKYWMNNRKGQLLELA
jgi:hypothetical protein